MNWQTVETASDDEPRCLAVEDRLFDCDWHFAEKRAGRWFDLSTGGEITPTHWMILPLPPSEAMADAA